MKTKSNILGNDLNWHEGTACRDAYPVSFDVTISNDAGVLGKVCTLIGEAQGNISDLEFINRNSDFYRLHIDIELRNIEQFHVVTTALEAEGRGCFSSTFTSGGWCST